MQIHNVQRNTSLATKKRVGRGGKRGKTSGRGHKGQKQHGGHGIRPEARDTIKKIPKLRGRGKNTNKPIQEQAQGVNISTLDLLFETGAIINSKALHAKGLVKKANGKMPKVKILGTGETKKKFTIEGCSLSKTANEKITAVGGTISA